MAVNRSPPPRERLVVDCGAWPNFTHATACFIMEEEPGRTERRPIRHALSTLSNHCVIGPCVSLCQTGHTYLQPCLARWHPLNGWGAQPPLRPFHAPQHAGAITKPQQPGGPAHTRCPYQRDSQGGSQRVGRRGNHGWGSLSSCSSGSRSRMQRNACASVTSNGGGGRRQLTTVIRSCRGAPGPPHGPGAAHGRRAHIMITH